MAIDNDSIVVCGSYIGTLSFDGPTLTSESLGHTDGFVVKLDNAGNHVWSTSVGGSDQCTIRTVSLDSQGNVIYAGDCLGSFAIDDDAFPGNGSFVGKRDSSGASLWAKSFGNARAYATAIGVSDRIFLTGDVTGPVNFGGSLLQANNNSRHVFLAAFDPSGDHVWSKVFGDPTKSGLIQLGRDLAVDSTGNVALAGCAEGSIDFGLGELTAAPPGYNPFVAAFDSDGVALSGNLFGGESQCDETMTFDPTDNVILGGSFAGRLAFPGTPPFTSDYYDMFLAKLPR